LADRVQVWETTAPPALERKDLKDTLSEFVQSGGVSFFVSKE